MKVLGLRRLAPGRHDNRDRTAYLGRPRFSRLTINVTRAPSVARFAATNIHAGFALHLELEQMFGLVSPKPSRDSSYDFARATNMFAGECRREDTSPAGVR